MTSPSGPEGTPSAGGPEPVSLGKQHPPSAADPEPPLDFDPYRFGAPEHPVPPEYAPPGYRPPPPTQPPPPPAFGRSYPAYGSQPQQGHPQDPSGSHQQYPPGPPPYQPYPQPRTGNGKAIAALVFGIASIVFCWVSILDALLVVPAIVFGALALRDARRGRANGRRMATWGIALGVVGAVFAAVLTVYISHRFGDCLHMKVGSSAYSQCIRDHLN